MPVPALFLNRVSQYLAALGTMSEYENSMFT